MYDIHKQDLIENKLSISYEAEDRYESAYGTDIEPEKAVLLVTRCCTINHDHIDLNKDQAVLLRDWLDSFIKGEFTPNA